MSLLDFYKEPAPGEPIQDKAEIDKKYAHFRWRIFYSCFIKFFCFSGTILRDNPPRCFKIATANQQTNPVDRHIQRKNHRHQFVGYGRLYAIRVKHPFDYVGGNGIFKNCESHQIIRLFHPLSFKNLTDASKPSRKTLTFSACKGNAS